MGLLALVPLVILFGFIGAFAWFGYQIFLYTNDLAEHGRKHMEKKNISFTKDGGLKVGVKDKRAEDIEDSTKSMFVKTWNLGNESMAAERKSSIANPKPGQ